MESLIAGHYWQMWAVLALVPVTIIALMLERIPMVATATMLLAGLMVLFGLAPLPGPNGENLLGAANLLQGFANPGLITIIGLLVVGQALIQTGALDGVATSLHQASGGSAALALLISLLPVAVLSSVLNNTPVVVIFIPIMTALAGRLKLSASRLLIPLSFASILGGMTTLIGSSTNLLVAGVAQEMGLGRIGFFDFVVPGMVLAGCGLPGFANFAGEVMIFFAAWSAGLKTVTVIAAWSALVIGGLYMMRAIRNILHGPIGGDWAKAADASPLIAAALGLLLAALLVFGFAPGLLTKRIEGEVTKIVSLAKPSAIAGQIQTAEAAGK